VSDQPAASMSDMEATGCCKVLLNFPCPKWQHFLQQVFFIVIVMRTSSLTSFIQFNSMIDLNYGYEILDSHMGVENVIILLGCKSVLICELLLACWRRL
jgi:hypothetical protein